MEDVSDAYVLVQHTRMRSDDDLNGDDDEQVSCLRKFPSNSIPYMLKWHNVDFPSEFCKRKINTTDSGIVFAVKLNCCEGSKQESRGTSNSEEVGAKPKSGEPCS